MAIMRGRPKLGHIRKHVVFSPDTWKRLTAYILKRNGKEAGFSEVIETAVREHLNQEGY